MRRVALTFVLVLASVAGCVQDPPVDEGAPASGANVTIDEARPEPTFNDIPDADLGYVATPDANATLDRAPVLVPGEWWRIELTDGFTGESTTFVRVVAKVEDELYVVGMPHEGWWKEAVIFHTPAFGDLNKDLSHRAHDVPFLPLQFPLADGATWETNFENADQPLTATVTVESPTTARVVFTGTQCGLLGLVGQCDPNAPEGTVIELLYDASMHEVVEFVHQTVSWRVLEHGYGFEGWVTVPRSEDLVFLHGRLGAPTFDFVNGGPAQPTDTVLVNGGFNRVSFILAAGNFLPPGTGGAYSEKATAPDGTAYELSMVPGEPFRFEFFEHANPDGEWLVEHTVAGPGAVFIEGIAYHQYDILLPSGDIRSDHSHQVVR